MTYKGGGGSKYLSEIIFSTSRVQAIKKYKYITFCSAARLKMTHPILFVKIKYEYIQYMCRSHIFV